MAALNDLGNALLQKGDFSEAISNYQKGFQADPLDLSIRENLSWLLATCPDDSVRNGKRALELALEANSLTGGEDPVALHILAVCLC